MRGILHLIIILCILEKVVLQTEICVLGDSVIGELCTQYYSGSEFIWKETTQTGLIDCAFSIEEFDPQQYYIKCVQDAETNCIQIQDFQV
jgi:hypothetical protein